ncbi:probable serine/threonine-protein kinase DDB_G0282963 [Pecten maximus]|uniref:probable serine/threonine-protein kinase DDB_G0282963 n=1 Tax=Pecten maximus TaxID=6579 RepID=UPI00145839D5|nr:probable serine/threonine-protein kinase DDB_G0282963 [Pecten maximus]
MPVSRHLVLATVTGFPDTQVIYPCCISCYSKLLKDQNQDRWLCCKCGQSCQSDQVEWRYRLALTITDGDTIASVCLFGSMLDQYFGTNATQFKRYLLGLESSCDHSDQLLKRAVERSFIGHSYYFGFKRTASTIRHCPNAPVTLRQIVDVLEPKQQTSHENLSHIVAFQILSSTSTTQTTVLNLMLLDSQKKSSHSTEKSLPQNVETKLTKKEQDNCSVKQLETKNDSSAVSCEGYSSGEGHSNLTCSPSFLSVCTSSFGQETALLSCDMSNSVDNISRENVSKRQSTNTFDSKGNFHQSNFLGQVWTEPLSSFESVSPKVAPDNICMDKSSTKSSPFKIQESSESHELLKSRPNRLDSSGYSSLLKISVNLEGNNSEDISLMNGSSNQCSWNKENFGDDKFDKGAETENDPYSESFNNSSFLLADGICSTNAQPLLKFDRPNRKSVKILHPLSQGNHILSSKSSSNNVSCPPRAQSGFCKGNFTTGGKIKDRFKKFTSSKTIRIKKMSDDKKHSLIRTRNFPGQQSMSCSVVAPVRNSKISKDLMDSVNDKVGKDNIPQSIPGKIMENNNPNIVFPESEDLWAYLTDQEGFGETESISLGKLQTSVQSKGDNHVAENVNRINSFEEDSDETFEEFFDPEFLNLEHDTSDQEDKTDERASDSKENNGKVEMHDTNEGIEAGVMLDFNEDTDIDTHNCDEIVQTGTKHSDEKIDTSTHSSDEEIDEGMHDFDEDVDSSLQLSEGEIHTSTQNCQKEIKRRAFYSDEEIDEDTQKSDIFDNLDPSGIHDLDEKAQPTTRMYGSHEALHTAETIGSVVGEINHTGNKTESGIQNSGIVLQAASSDSEKHVTDHSTLNNLKPDNNPQEGLESMPESEGLYAFLDSTFGEVTDEQNWNVLPDKEGDKEKVVEKEEIFNVFDIENGNKVTQTKLIDDTNNDKIGSVSVGNDRGNLNCNGEADYVKITNFKEDTEGNRDYVLPSGDETMEHLESMFDDSFDGEDTRNEDLVDYSSQEILLVKYPTHKDDSTTNKSQQSSSKSCQSASYSKKESASSSSR